MNYPNSTVYNEDITLQRVLAIMLCFTIVLIPLSLCWLYCLRPTDNISGNVTNKRTNIETVMTGKGGTPSRVCYVSIGIKEYKVSSNIYSMLALGDYISATCRKRTMYSFRK